MMRIRSRLALGVVATLTLLAGPAPCRAAFSLTTLFAANNGQSGNMFDVLTGSSALNVTSIGLNLETTGDTIQIYKKSGTWVGFDATPAAWTLVNTVTGVVSNGTNIPTFINTPGLTLAANARTALYITTVSGTLGYTNGTAVGNVAASDPRLTIFEGAGEAYPFAATFTPRIWNGTINYDVVSSAVPEPASLALLGLGCTGLLAGSALRNRRRDAARPGR